MNLNIQDLGQQRRRLESAVRGHERAEERLHSNRRKKLQRIDEGRSQLGQQVLNDFLISI